MQTLSMRDAMTARHSAAVARYAREVARMLGLSEREQDLIHTAALLHDIGKFIFPDSILLADRKLTDDEWETVKLHPEQGAKLVRRIEGYGPVADIIISHHERVDGKGYPHGVAGDEIPLGSRIISVADTYDVMTSRDSYRRPVSSEAAIVELRRVAGCQLDPMVVERFRRDGRVRSCCVPSRGRGGLRARTRVRPSGRGLRATARRCGLDARSIQRRRPQTPIYCLTRTSAHLALVSRQRLASDPAGSYMRKPIVTRLSPLR